MAFGLPTRDARGLTADRSSLNGRSHDPNHPTVYASISGYTDTSRTSDLPCSFLLTVGETLRR